MKMLNNRYTAILSFEVIKPSNELETAGEILQLSQFGEYCPEKSLRGYQLQELLMKPEYYQPKEIIQKGETIAL